MRKNVLFIFALIFLISACKSQNSMIRGYDVTKLIRVEQKTE